MEAADNSSKRTCVKRARIYSHIRNQLNSDAYLPGTRLPIEDLARRFGVSATPVREALLQLAAEKIIDSEANRGFFVKPDSSTHYCDLYDICLAFLEHQLIRLSEHIPEDIDGRWEAISDRLNELATHDETSATLIEELCFSMFAGCNNIEMLRLAERILARTHRFRIAILRDEGIRKDIRSDLKVIIEALGGHHWLYASRRLRIMFDRKRRHLSNILSYSVGYDLTRSLPNSEFTKSRAAISLPFCNSRPGAGP